MTAPRSRLALVVRDVPRGFRARARARGRYRRDRGVTIAALTSADAHGVAVGIHR